MTQGIHHITAISSNAQKTVQFYRDVLQLRMVKQTVNFDSPDTYHLYFGNDAAEPGTILTFFPFELAGTGMRGTGQATKIQFSVPMGSLSYWLERFHKFGVRNQGIQKQFGKSVIRFFDEDGLQMELVMAETESTTEKIIGFFGVEFSVREASKTIELLGEIFGYEVLAEEDNVQRLRVKGDGHAKFIDIFQMSGWPEGIISAGTVHHVALRAKDEAEQLKWQTALTDKRIQVTEVIDRKYFKSVYFHEPGGVHLEIATDEPGFAVDESTERLGERLMLPQMYENMRHRILKLLPALKIQREEFVYKYIAAPNTKKTLVLLHGTGGDENDLVGLADEVAPDYGVLSLRGNVVQNGMNRFFERDSNGPIQQSLQAEGEKLIAFLQKFMDKHQLQVKDLIFLGLSNGANMIQHLINKQSGLIVNAVLMHPMLMPHPEALESASPGKILITSGKHDEYLSWPEDGEKIQADLSARGYDVEVFLHGGGHQLDSSELPAVRDFLADLSEKGE